MIGYVLFTNVSLLFRYWIFPHIQWKIGISNKKWQPYKGQREHYIPVHGLPLSKSAFQDHMDEVCIVWESSESKKERSKSRRAVSMNLKLKDGWHTMKETESDTEGVTKWKGEERVGYCMAEQ